MPAPTMPGEPSFVQPHHSSEQHSQTTSFPSGGPPQYPSQAMLQSPPGVVPPQFPGYGAPQFNQGSAQAPMMQPSGQGSQQMSNNVNYQLPAGSPQFMYLGNGRPPAPNAPGPQAMSFPGLGRQLLSPGPQMMQAPGYGNLAFPQGPGRPMPQMPQFPMYGSQQFPPGMEPQMMHFPEHGGQHIPFAPPRHPYNR